MKRLATHARMIVLAGLLTAPCFGYNDSLYYLFQRSTYLEHLLMPGGWWANPALVADIDKSTALTANVTPLGYRYTIASAKFIKPIGEHFNAGFGILGTGKNSGGSLQGSNSGAEYRSSFSFTNPSMQVSAGTRLPHNFLSGVLCDLGYEVLPDGSGAYAWYPVVGIGTGIITPYLNSMLSFALSVHATKHFWQEPYWDNDGKAGVRFMLMDSLVRGALEYTFSFSDGRITSYFESPDYYYHTAKLLTSTTMYDIAGLLLGISDDLSNLSANGTCLHGGIELRASDVYPFFGGYEIALSLTKRDLVIHRLLVGYSFLRRK